ncbi:hypothetical protein Hanom_Chr09g00809951 [Helianthus anomalus]
MMWIQTIIICQRRRWTLKTKLLLAKITVLCQNCSYLYQLQSNVILTSCRSSRVHDVDTKYHNLSTKTLDLEDQTFVGEANCVLSEDNPLAVARVC